MGKFKNAISKAQTTRRQREADEKSTAEASAADADGHADGHADSNAGDADDAGAQSSSSIIPIKGPFQSSSLSNGL